MEETTNELKARATDAATAILDEHFFVEGEGSEEFAAFVATIRPLLVPLLAIAWVQGRQAGGDEAIEVLKASIPAMLERTPV